MPDKLDQEYEIYAVTVYIHYLGNSIQEALRVNIDDSDIQSIDYNPMIDFIEIVYKDGSFTSIPREKIINFKSRPKK